ncbi:MAG: hypothetical protein IT453_16990 [Planctomycetes bacterium]|jgi:hypothetical protein|nr:hypothetical protein [Planctomycetota bacterium]
MQPVSGKRVVLVVFGGIALLTGLAVWWFMRHAEEIRRGGRSPSHQTTVLPGPTDAPSDPAPVPDPAGR